MKIEIITKWDDGEPVDPPRLFLNDHLHKPEPTPNGWMFTVPLDTLTEENK